MKLRSVAALILSFSIVAVSPVSAGLRGRDDNNGINGNNGNGQGNNSNNGNNGNTGNNGNNGNNGNGQGKGYYEMVHDMKASLENGEIVDGPKVKQLMQKFKQEHLKVDRKKKEFKGAALKVLERNKNKGENITEHQLVMETLSEIVDEELHYELLGNLDNGYAHPEDVAAVDPLAGENEEEPDINYEYDGIDYQSSQEEIANEDHGRRLGVPTTRNRWAGGIIKYTVVLEHNFAGYYLWANRVLPAMAELEDITNLKFELAGWVWTTASAQADGTAYIRATSGGCSSYIGAPASWTHYVSIGPSCSRGNILHELLHTAGMHHQQVAQYRDKYITVNFGNIRSGYSGNFAKQYNHGLEFVYDYGSIMHYGEYGFSTNGGKTIDCRGNPCGQRAGLSYWDIWEIVYYYYGYYFVNGNL